MRSGSHRPMNAEDHQMMNQFMSGEATNSANNAFTFDQMRHELGGVQNGAGGSGAGQTGWSNEFSRHGHAANGGTLVNSSPAPAMARAGDARWGNEFNAPAATLEHNLTHLQAQTFGSGMSLGMGHTSMSGMSGMSRMYTPHSVMPGTTTTGPLARIVELDNQNWEEHFRQIEESAISQANAKGKGTTTSDMETVQGGEETAASLSSIVEEEGQSASDMADFEIVWSNLKSQVLDNMDPMDGMNMMDLDGTMGEEKAYDYDYNRYTKERPDYGKYQFEENTQYMNENDPFTIGVRIMEGGGKLSEAALAFEAAVQRDQNHVEAWARLGSVQAQNEKEDSAIRALERCIDLEPGNLAALMTLAVSYTNESYEEAAYTTLEKWIATKYPAIVEQARTSDPSLGTYAKYELHDRVTELFIRAAQLSPDGANMDAELQDGLGVLFYGSADYDKAIDCFRASLAVRPNDPLLWNRLGATLANSNRSEEAIEAYSRALELRPSFVRARYNIGVSCVNIGCYHEAAQHLLTALAMNTLDDHASSTSSSSVNEVLANQSTNLLATLKRVFLAMNRRDLAEKVGNGMDLKVFHSEFDF